MGIAALRHGGHVRRGLGWCSPSCGRSTPGSICPSSSRTSSTSPCPSSTWPSERREWLRSCSCTSPRRFCSTRWASTWPPGRGLRHGPANHAAYAAHLRGRPGAGAQPAGVSLCRRSSSNSVEFMGQAAVPLMLLVLGMTIAAVPLHPDPTHPGGGLHPDGGGLRPRAAGRVVTGLDGIPRAVVIFESAMPGAVVARCSASKYKNEAELVSSVVLATTRRRHRRRSRLCLYYLT